MEWVSVKDRLPPLRSVVLVFVPNASSNGYVLDFRCRHTPFFFLTGTEATHWMPLPKPPVEAEYAPHSHA